MNFHKDYQNHFQTISQDSFVIEYLFIPIIIFLVIILIYLYIKKNYLKMIGKIWKILKNCKNYLIQEQLTKMNSKRKRVVLLQNGDVLVTGNVKTRVPQKSLNHNSFLKK